MKSVASQDGDATFAEIILSMTNPLLKDFNTPFGTAPFEEIKTEHFLPALKEAIQEGLAEVQAICDQTEAPNFTNTIIALEEAGESVSRIAEIFFNLNSAETNEEIQMLARDFSPLLSEYRNDILLNPALFDRVKTVYQEAGQDTILFS